MADAAGRRFAGEGSQTRQASLTLPLVRCHKQGALLVQRVLFSFSALLCCSPAAWAHHVPVTAEVPWWNTFLWVGVALLVVGEAVFLGALRGRDEGERFGRVWALMPLTVLAGLLVARYAPLLRAPAERAAVGPDAVRVAVVGRQWQWDVSYPETGVTAVGEIHLPAGRDARLALSSSDVLHSFEIPSLRVRRDVLPGRPQEVMLCIARPGRYPVYCGAACGRLSDEMPGVIAVEPPDEYNRWVAQRRVQPSAGRR